jgi:dephospho-CoA kinase
MLLVGVTGNYGMGKSTVLPMFQKLGASVLDTDKIVSLLLREKEVLEKIRRLLGDAVFYKDGRLNRKKVAGIIFSDSNARHALEDILHPLVFKRMHNFIAAAKNKDKIIAVEVPLLFERGYEDRFDRTITVFSREGKALDRLEKTGIKRKDAIKRLESQLPVEEKIKRSDFIIDNNGPIEKTMQQVKKIYIQLVKEEKDGDNHRSRSLRQKLS